MSHPIATQWPPRKTGDSSGAAEQRKPINVVTSLFGECLCQPFPFTDTRGLSPNSQFIELHGIEFIGLGAVVDELTAKERVYDTVEQLTNRTERLISIGYLVDEELEGQDAEKIDQLRSRKISETVPLDLWNRNYPNDNSMSRSLKKTIEKIKRKEFGAALEDFNKDLEKEKAHINRGINRFMVGITAHNIAVILVLAGRDDKAFPLFEEAVNLKRNAFGPEHPEVAVSLDELGIQLFALERFEEAMAVFNEVRRIRTSAFGTASPKLAMVLNNIACCNFQMGNHTAAILNLQEARQIQQKVMGSTAKADLDLLHVAVTLCNYGYLQLRLKNYDEARSVFEEALLIQQSVLGDAYNHRAIRDTRSNLEFTNAFHS